MDRRIPLVISEGDPFTRGFHLGRSQTERVIRTITAYMDIFAQTSGLIREAVLTHAERFIPSIAHHAPHLLEEMRGIAEGPPCENAYHRLSLEDCFRVTSYRQTGY